MAGKKDQDHLWHSEVGGKNQEHSRWNWGQNASRDPYRYLFRRLQVKKRVSLVWKNKISYLETIDLSRLKSNFEPGSNFPKKPTFTYEHPKHTLIKTCFGKKLTWAHTHWPTAQIDFFPPTKEGFGPEIGLRTKVRWVLKHIRRRAPGLHFGVSNKLPGSWLSSWYQQGPPPCVIWQVIHHPRAWLARSAKTHTHAHT